MDIKTSLKDIPKCPLTPEEVALVKSAAADFQSLGPLLSTDMYDHFFEENPPMKAKFSADFLTKPPGSCITLMAKTQAHVVFGFMSHIDKLEVIHDDLERVAVKHVSRAITNEMYPAYAAAMFWAVSKILGDKVPQETLDAWCKAFNYMKDVLIQMEITLADQIAEVENSWRGFRLFKLVAKVPFNMFSELSDDDSIDGDAAEAAGLGGHNDSTISEPDSSVQLRFEPTDGGPLPNLGKGHYVCVKFNMEGVGMTHRNYMVAPDCDPKDGYISLNVSKRDGSLVSNCMMDDWVVGEQKVYMSPPMGSFLLMETMGEH